MKNSPKIMYQKDQLYIKICMFKENLKTIHVDQYCEIMIQTTLMGESEKMCDDTQIRNF